MALPDPSTATTVVVTGASRGIGRALAEELARRGHGVTLVARSAEELEQLAAGLEADHGVAATAEPADLADDADRDRLLAALRAGRDVVGLCNAAGMGAIGPVVEHDPDDEQRLVRVNALALHHLSVELAGDLVRRGGGAILNVGSILGFAPIPQNASYAATKAFVGSFSEALHAELAGSGVSCTVVAPGPTRTAIWKGAGAPAAQDLIPDPLWQPPERVAREAVTAMVAGRRTVVPGLTNKLLALGYRLTPRTALLPLTRAAQSEGVRRRLAGRG